jgi:hypothetical protein
MATNRKPPTGALTERDIARARADDDDLWLVDATRSRGTGRLALRVTPGGAKRFYFRYTGTNNKRVLLALGTWHPDAGDGETSFTLAQARTRFAEWSALLQGAAAGDLRGFLERRAATTTAVAVDAALGNSARPPATAAGDGSLRALLDAYVAGLRDAKKPSARDVANLFKNHVYAAWPELAAAPAASITSLQITNMLRRLVDAKHGRTAGKLRSYLRAAFATAAESSLDASVPATLSAFGITSNPAAPTKALTKFNRARHRNLDKHELGFFWARLRERSDLPGLALIVNLLLGGQRLAQLLRLQSTEVQFVTRVLLLRDRKGRRSEPRQHWLPITPPVATALKALVERNQAAGCPWVFSTTLRRPICSETLSAIVNEICAAMLDAGETREKFEMRDIRRTVESRLGELSVSRDLRAQLQSHGTSGVQEIHYDMWTYLPEKREALEQWERQLDRWATEALAPRQGQVAEGGGNVIALAPHRTRRDGQ